MMFAMIISQMAISVSIFDLLVAQLILKDDDDDDDEDDDDDDNEDDDSTYPVAKPRMKALVL